MYPIQVVLSQSASYLHQDDIRLFLRFTQIFNYFFEIRGSNVVIVNERISHSDKEQPLIAHK